MYCGGALPEPTVQAPAEVVLPDDIDQLVRQAMTMGTTHKLQEAMVAHQSAAETEPEAEVEVDRRALLDRLVSEAERARDAHESARDEDRDASLRQVRALLAEWGPLGLPEAAPIASTAKPEVLLPKYRRAHALVLDGPDDVGRAQEIVDAIGVDGVTARMIAIAKHPRIVLRSERSVQLEHMATVLRSKLSMTAVVVDADALRLFGPAVLLADFSHGPETVCVNDWTSEAPPSGVRELMSETPVLVVPGEVVLMRSRAVRGGGRLKHLRDGRMTPASERRLAVLDMHTPSGIVRMLEGTTDVSAAPGSVEGSFRSTLRNMMDTWESEGVQVLDARTVNPSGQGGADRIGEDGGQLTTSWPEWEEHTRACRALFIGPGSVPPTRAADCDSRSSGPQ